MSKEFLLFLVNEQYGDTFNSLINVIQSDPSQSLTLSQLLKEMKIGFSELRKLLILSIKNNILKLDNQSQEQQLKHPEEICEEKYIINTQEILQIYRYPRFIDYASKHIGILEAMIIEQLLLQQSSTAEQCVNEILVDISMQIKDVNVEDMRGKFFNLVEKGFIKEAYLLNFSRYFEEKESKEEELEKIELEKPKRKTKKVKLNEELKTQIEKSSANKNEAKTFQEQKHKIFKVNYRQFIHEFRIQQIFNLIKFQANIQSASILQFMLAHSKLIDQTQKFKFTEPLTISEIKDLLPNQFKIDENQIEKYLKQLQTDSIQSIQVVKEKEGVFEEKYQINLLNIIKFLQLKIAEQIIEKKYSNYHSRVVRILEQTDCLDDKTIATSAILPLSATRSILLELQRDGIVNQIELNNEKGYIIYGYTLKIFSTFKQIIDLMYKSIFNMKILQTSQMRKLKQLQSLTKPTENGEDLLEQSQNKILKLQAAIYDIDNDLMVFSEF